jgi:hypothetical protein
MTGLVILNLFLSTCAFTDTLGFTRARRTCLAALEQCVTDHQRDGTALDVIAVACVREYLKP